MDNDSTFKLVFYDQIIKASNLLCDKKRLFDSITIDNFADKKNCQS